MRLPPISSVKRRFPATVRERGEGYFRQGRVRLVSVGDEAVEATVQGTYLYEVVLRREDDGNAWAATCTCRAFRDRGPCKHIWATILAARSPAGSSPVSASPASGQQQDGVSLDEEIRRLVRDLPHLRPFAEKLYGIRALEEAPRRFPGRHRRRAASKDWPAPLVDLQALAAQPKRTAGAPPTRRLCFVLHTEAAVTHGSLVVELMAQRPYKRGGWSDPRPLSLGPNEEPEDLPDADRACLASLRGGLPHGVWGYGRTSRFELSSVLAATLLPRIAEQSRLQISLGGGALTDPLAWDGGGRWEFRLSLERNAMGGTALKGILVRGEERISLHDPFVILDRGLMATREKLAEVDWHGAWQVACVLRRSERVEVPIGREPDLIGVVSRLPGNLPIEAPGILREAAGPPTPRLHLAAPGTIDAAHGGIGGQVLFDYGEVCVGIRDTGRVQRVGDDLVHVRRDDAAERAALDRLAAAGARLEPPHPPDCDITIHVRLLAPLVRSLLSEGWKVLADGKPVRSQGTLRLSVRSGIDWFDLDGGAAFGEASATIPVLLRAVRSGVRVVRLSDGSLGVLPEDWLAGWGLADGATEREEGLRFPRSQVWLLDMLLAERGEVEVDAAFEHARTALKRFERFELASEPEGFEGELRPYQRDGLGWLRLLRELGLGGCLADDMGLGKTVQVLALLCQRTGRKRRPSLVVAPRSLVFNWVNEARRFTPALSVAAHHGPDRARDAAGIVRHDLVVTTYGTLRRDIGFLSRIPFEHAILDEAQAVKNAASLSAKAARLLRADHRLVLTGTPVENHLDDLWSLFEFLNPGMLGRSRVFRELVSSKPGRGSGRRERSAAGDTARGAGDSGTEGVVTGDPASLAVADPHRALARALRPFLLRRTKEQVLKDLPPKVEQVIACDLEGKERRRYEELRDHYRSSLLARADEQGLERIRMHVLEALLRLRQAACHPALLDRSRIEEGSAKLDALLPMLEEVRESGHKALVFSQFTSFLAVVRDRLDRQGWSYEYLDGRTRNREERVRRFQEDPACPLFLISLKAGGFGLNLTAADYVFLLDPWWNPAVERQAIDRTHRIGQTRPVNAYRLVARDTIEEKVLELQERKRGLAEAILGEAGGALREMTKEDLEALLT